MVRALLPKKLCVCVYASWDTGTIWRIMRLRDLDLSFISVLLLVFFIFVVFDVKTRSYDFML